MSNHYDILSLEAKSPKQGIPLQQGLMVRDNDIGKFVVAGKYHDEGSWRFLDAEHENFWRKGKDGCKWLHEAFAVMDVVIPQKDNAMMALGFKITRDPHKPGQVLLVQPRLRWGWPLPPWLRQLTKKR